MDFMKSALMGKPEHSMPEPEGITSVRIDPETGLLAHPGQEDAIFELFTTNTVPTKESTENSSDDDSNNSDNIIDGTTTPNDDDGQLF